MDKYGLIGEKLGHSYSGQIHKMLGRYEYGMYELSPDELGTFLEAGPLRGMNVTMPYKKAVIPYCARLSPTAERLGSVNTMARFQDGWHGFNTDYDGFAYTLRRSGADIQGRKALVFGGGGVTPTVCAVLRDFGAGEVTVISRRGENGYDTLTRHKDARILVNATPVGMFPNNGRSAFSPGAFPKCEAVFDLVYNPARTSVLLEAEGMGAAAENGLAMLVYQAARACEIFTGEKVPESTVENIISSLSDRMENIVLVGMPGCGKTTLGRALARRLGREFFDADEELASAVGLGIPEIFAKGGEELFRKLETEALAKLGKRSGCVIATGGGCVTRQENYDLLHQNGRIIWIRRELEALAVEGRPLSQANSAALLYEQRREKYAAFADAEIENNGEIDDVVKRLEAIL